MSALHDSRCARTRAPSSVEYGSARDVLRLVVGQGMTVVAIGLAIGLLATFGATRWVSSLLFGVKPWDVPTLLAVSGLLIAVSLAASLVPPRRAVVVALAIVLLSD